MDRPGPTFPSNVFETLNSLIPRNVPHRVVGIVASRDAIASAWLNIVSLYVTQKKRDTRMLLVAT